MSEPGKAVFLSYGSQDAEAAKRICDALRAAGVEVWFDQSELVGGDQWDQKIRGQISSCALFMPIVSANTQARKEGYFRIEWRLAAQRTHAMSDDSSFLMPVVVDDTKDTEARVPAEFKAVQWTKLPAGEADPRFCARVKALLSEEPSAKSEDGGAAPRANNPEPRTQNQRLRRFWWVLPMFGVAMALVLVMKESRKAPAPSPGPPTAAPRSEAQRLADQVRDQLTRIHLDPPLLATADDLCRRAAALDPLDPEVWAAWSQVSAWNVYMAYDTSPQRIEAARAHAEHALRLAPKSFEARLAQANYLVRGHGETTVPARAAQAEALLKELLDERPAEARTLFTAAILARNLGHWVEARAFFTRMAENPAFRAAAWAELGYSEWRSGDPAAAEAAADRSIAVQPYATNLTLKLYLAMYWHGDLDAAEAILARFPADLMEEDKVLSIACQLEHWRRMPQAMLQHLQPVTREWLNSVDFDGPTALWTGCARQMAGQHDAARFAWEAGLRLVETRLAADSTSGALIAWKGILQGLLGAVDDSEKNLRLATQLSMLPGQGPPPSLILHVRALNGYVEAACEDLKKNGQFLSGPELRLSPWLDALRGNPRFEALLAQRQSPGALATQGAITALDNKSVAVLAFANLSDDKGNEYFSDGISEELLNVLAKIPGLKVTARTSSFHFKGKDTPIPEIAQQLGVAYVVEGSVRKAGEKVRITAQLIKAADGFHVWSDTFTRDLKDIFAVQDEIAGLIAQNLQVKLDAAPRAQATVDPEAHQFFLRAQAEWSLRTKPGRDRAQELLREVLRLDPEFAPAYALLAYMALTGEDSFLGFDRAGPLPPWLANAQAYAEKARDLDPRSPDAHVALGGVHAQRFNLVEAEQELRRAIVLSPNHAYAYLWLARVLDVEGRTEEAIASMQRAAELDPLTSRVADNLGMLFLNAGRLTAARAAIERALLLQPDSRQALSMRARLHEAAGEIAPLRRMFAEFNQRAGHLPAWDPYDCQLVVALLKGAEPGEALAAYQRIPDGLFGFKVLAALELGRIDDAVALLKQGQLAFWGANQIFSAKLDPIRNRPEFRAFLERSGLWEAYLRHRAWRAAQPPEGTPSK